MSPNLSVSYSGEPFESNGPKLLRSFICITMFYDCVPVDQFCITPHKGRQELVSYNHTNFLTCGPLSPGSPTVPFEPGSPFGP